VYQIKVFKTKKIILIKGIQLIGLISAQLIIRSFTINYSDFDMPPRHQQGRGRRQPYQLRPRYQNQSAQHARANRRQNPGPVQPDPVPDVQNLAPVVEINT
jgi:hypothetical protein